MGKTNPKVTFTERWITSLKTPEKKTITYDAKTAGLGIKQEPLSGTISFFWFRGAGTNGKPIWKTIGTTKDTTLEQARTAAAKFNFELAKWKLDGGPNPFEEQHVGGEITFGKAAEDYITRYVMMHSVKPEKAGKYFRWIVSKYLSKWDTRPLSSITRKNVSDLYKNIAVEHGKTTANRTLQFCRACFNYCSGDAGLWQGRNPAQLSKKERYAENEVCRCLDPEELLRFTQALDQELNTGFRHFVSLALATAQRKGNILGMRWAAVDLVTQTWTILKSEAKNKKSNTVDLTPAAMRVLRERLAEREDDNPWVFPSILSKSGHVEDYKPQWLRFVEKVGLDFPKNDPRHFREHDLRHTAISYMVMGGKSLEQAGAAIGHLSTTSTKRYSHIQRVVAREAMLAAEREMAKRIAAAKKQQIATRKPRQIPTSTAA